MGVQQQTLFLATDTLLDAREMVKRGLEGGVTCPCCDQFCKLYPRQIHSTIARSLIKFYWLDRQAPGEYIHIERLCPDRRTSGDFSKLAFWELIKASPKDLTDSTRSSTGFWKLTETGVAFIERKIRVPRIKYIYNDHLMGQSDDQVDIVQCLKKKFNYAELMGKI